MQIEQQEVEIQLDAYQTCLQTIGNVCKFGRTWLPCICFCVEYPYQTIKQGQEGMLERFGQYVKTVKPGLIIVNPCSEKLRRVNIYTQIQELNRQTVLTKDNITIMIDAAVYYRTINPYKQLYEVEDVSDAVRFHTYAVLRNVCGIYQLQELLEKRYEVTRVIYEQVSEHVGDWGITIDNVFIKDMMLSTELQDSLSAAAKEQRLAASKIISAKADVESAKLMREAADILDSRPAMQIRFIETLQMLTKSNNSKIVFLPNEAGEIDHKMTQGLLS